MATSTPDDSECALCASVHGLFYGYPCMFTADIQLLYFNFLVKGSVIFLIMV